MTKTKRKLNKLQLIGVRLYTVTGNKGDLRHHFIKGEVVRRHKSFLAPFANDNEYYQSVTTGMTQFVSSTDII